MRDTVRQVELATPRLRMRPFGPEDFDDLCRLNADPEVMRYIGVRSPEEVAAVLATVLDHWRQHGFGFWVLLGRQDGLWAGVCGLRHCTEGAGIEVGYTLHKESWGKGLATEAGRACLRFGFDTLGLAQVLAFADPANRASTRVREKLGMRYERRVLSQGRERVCYAISRAEYAASCPTT